MKVFLKFVSRRDNIMAMITGMFGVFFADQSQMMGYSCLHANKISVKRTVGLLHITDICARTPLE